MDIEQRIQKKMLSLNVSRIEAIACMDLGLRSEAAKRASDNRIRRKELVKNGMPFFDACAVVKVYNN